VTKENAPDIVFVIGSMMSGGAERIASQLINRFVNQKHNVLLVTFSSEDDFYDIDPRCRRQNYSPKGNGAISRTINLIFKLRQVLVSRRPNLGVISFIDYSNVVTLVAALGLKIPVIVSERVHPAHHKVSLFVRLGRRFFYPKATSVVGQTTSVASYLSQRYGLKNVTVIPNPVKIKQKTCQGLIPFDPDWPKIVLFSVSRICDQKRLDVLVTAAVMLWKRHGFAVDIHIFGAGSSEEINNLFSLVPEGSSVKLEVKEPIKDVFEKCPKNGVFILTSDYEGFPNALVEAIAEGYPVFTSRFDGIEDVLANSAIEAVSFECGDASSLSDLIYRYFTDFDYSVASKKALLEAKNCFQPIEQIAPEFVRLMEN